MGESHNFSIFIQQILQNRINFNSNNVNYQINDIKWSRYQNRKNKLIDLFLNIHSIADSFDDQNIAIILQITDGTLNRTIFSIVT